jgi:serralysin
MENANHYCVCISKAKQDFNTKAALLNGARWNAGDVIKVAFLEGDASLRQAVREVAEGWVGPDMARLTLAFVESGPAEVRIAFQQGNGSWSHLGTECRKIPEGEPTMNYGWLTPESSPEEIRRVVLHEFGHALGLIHEHQNPKGGIEWDEPAVIADLSGPPNFWDEATIRHNVLDHYEPGAVTGTEVDPKSIMMYPIPATWTNGRFSSDLNGDLSATDVEFIRGAYPQAVPA